MAEPNDMPPFPPLPGVEAEIQAARLAGPRVTREQVEAEIASEHYFTALDGVLTGAPIDVATADALGRLTFCALVLRNGFVATGVSACASPENFDAETGRRVARQNALDQVWLVLGYQLRTHLAAQERAHSSAE